jgi:cysteinyl-tRNA synthetase
MKLYSTLDRKIVEIQPNKPGEIKMYNCGPTVYSRMQIGNLRAYINWDVLHRALVYLGFKVTRVMNMTDVGHMTQDEDFGEDRVEKMASKEGLNPLDIADKYIKTVLEDFSQLNILAPNGEKVDPDWDVHKLDDKGFTRATDYVDRMIEIIKKMEQNGYTYETDQALYFDVTKIPDYTIFTGQSLDEKEVGAREEVGVDPNKKHPADFVLWMKRKGKYENHIMHWNSPWGDGFPGWHIECSAMSTAKLGENFDIHTGGKDNAAVHHPNERAQNIGAFTHPVVKYWLHNEWLVNPDGGKLSKSIGSITLSELINEGYDPMDFRYWILSSGYRVQMKVSDEALDGARNARLNIVKRISELGDIQGNILENYKEKFVNALENNLNTAEGLAILNDLLKSDEKKEDILATVLDFDKVLGLNLDNITEGFEDRGIYISGKYPDEVAPLLEQREQARKDKNFEESDRLRNEISNLGYDVLDTPEGQQLKRK